MFLELRHLRTLLAICDGGSLVRAAESLHITQSALSHQIKSLEQYFDTKLFMRSSKPLHFTVGGERLLALARQVLPLVEGAESDLRQVAQGKLGRLHIAIECHACFEWLGPVLNRYRHEWPQIEVDICVGVSFDALAALQKGEVDLVISSDPIPSTVLKFVELFQYESLLAMAPDHTLLQQRSIRPEDLATETLITYPVKRQRLDLFSRFLQPANIEPAAVRQSELTAVILLLVASGRGVAVLPDWVLREAVVAHNIATRPLGSKGIKGQLYAAVRQSDYPLAYLQDFIQHARQGRE